MVNGPHSYGGDKNLDANCLIMTVNESYWMVQWRFKYLMLVVWLQRKELARYTYYLENKCQ